MSSNPFQVPTIHDDLIDDDDDDTALSQHQCVSCKKMSPSTRTAHTLISAQHGWRVARTPIEGGGFHFEWLCPPCWAKARQQKVNPL